MRLHIHLLLNFVVFTVLTEVDDAQQYLDKVVTKLDLLLLKLFLEEQRYFLEPLKVHFQQVQITKLILKKEFAS